MKSFSNDIYGNLKYVILDNIVSTYVTIHKSYILKKKYFWNLFYPGTHSGCIFRGGTYKLFYFPPHKSEQLTHIFNNNFFSINLKIIFNEIIDQ